MLVASVFEGMKDRDRERSCGEQGITRSIVFTGSSVRLPIPSTSYRTLCDTSSSGSRPFAPTWEDSRSHKRSVVQACRSLVARSAEYSRNHLILHQNRRSSPDRKRRSRPPFLTRVGTSISRSYRLGRVVSGLHVLPSQLLSAGLSVGGLLSPWTASLVECRAPAFSCLRPLPFRFAHSSGDDGTRQ